MTSPRIIVLTSIAMLAFAGNSILCRIALQQTGIDAMSFTSIRLLCGAVFLWLLVLVRGRRLPGRGDWLSSMALFGYAVGFSFAYMSLPTATGALLLFAAVQATMIGYGLWSGERLEKLQLLGLAFAVAGIVGLLLPGISAPAPLGSLLMMGAGVAWGLYSIRGKGAGDPFRVTAGNFLRTLPFAAALSLLSYPAGTVDSAGLWCAIASGALASGAGYALWYTVLPGLKATTASIVQLSVPVLAAFGGVAFLSEPISVRLVLVSFAVLGGIALVFFQRQRDNVPGHNRSVKADHFLG